MKKTMAIVLSLLLCLSLVPAAALASEEPEAQERDVFVAAEEQESAGDEGEPAPEGEAAAAVNAEEEEPAVTSEEDEAAEAASGVPVEEGSEEPATDGAPGGSSGSTSATPYTHLSGTGQVILDNDHWSKNSGAWYQTGLVYCTSPASTTYETLNIYVPLAYMDGTQNSTGYYTCTVLPGVTVGSYTSDNAPYVMPVNTPGYSCQTAASGYSSYVSSGMIYVGAGCRGKGCDKSVNGGAPWGVADLKAAIRFIRYSGSMLPGNTEYYFAFGHSGGGAQTSVLGASGNSALYTPYLTSIGACMTYDDGAAISDAIYGAMAWCPITSLDMADAAYEWNLGQYVRTGYSQLISYDLADAYAEYINALGLTDAGGNSLTLQGSDEYEYAAGSYYDFLLSEIERSRQNYIADNGSTPSEATSLYALVANGVKKAGKSVPAFDGWNAAVTENLVFGDGNNGQHFDSALAAIFADSAARYTSAYGSYAADYAAAYAAGVESRDALGMTTATRVDMINPMYYLCDYYDGAGTADVAPYWRIHSGLAQTDTSLCVEMNLALALQSYGVNALELEMVWGQGHTAAERTGSSTANFIAWVKACVYGTISGSGDFGSLYTPGGSDGSGVLTAARILRHEVGLIDAIENEYTLPDAAALLRGA